MQYDVIVQFRPRQAFGPAPAERPIGIINGPEDVGEAGSFLTLADILQKEVDVIREYVATL